MTVLASEKRAEIRITYICHIRRIPRKNPLTYEQKSQRTFRKMFPQHSRNVILRHESQERNGYCQVHYTKGFEKVTMVVGADRITEFETLLTKYNGVKARHGFYDFEDRSTSLYQRGIETLTQKGLRECLHLSNERTSAKGDFRHIYERRSRQQCPPADTKKLFDDIRGLEWECQKLNNHKYTL